MLSTVYDWDSSDLYPMEWVAALPIEHTAATAMVDEPDYKPTVIV
jgi:hypothetical protein